MHAPTAIYPGSFDPMTFGHLDILARARRLFPRVVVAVGAQPAKTGCFTQAERVELARCSAREARFGGVEIAAFDGLLVEFAKSVGARVLIRGLRAVSDFEYELQMALTNRRLAPEIETVFLMAEGRHAFLASSLIKDVARHGGDVTPFVPPCVATALARKLLDQPAP